MRTCNGHFSPCHYSNAANRSKNDARAQRYVAAPRSLHRSSSSSTTQAHSLSELSSNETTAAMGRGGALTRTQLRAQIQNGKLTRKQLWAPRWMLAAHAFQQNAAQNSEPCPMPPTRLTI